MEKIVKLISVAAAVLISMFAVGEAFASHAFEGDELTLNEYLVLPRVGRYGRVPIHIDPIQAKLAMGVWEEPQVDEEVRGHDGKQVHWSRATAQDNGWLEHKALRGGYAYVQVTSQNRQAVLLEASGHAMVFVNGEPRAGDPYLTGRTVVPILLSEGSNEFLFHAAAGKLRARLARPTQDVLLDGRDVTLPDLVRGETEPVWLGVLAINARDRSIERAQVTSQADGGTKVTSIADSVPPMGVRKIAIPLMPPDWEKVPESTEELSVAMTLAGDAGMAATLKVKLKIVGAQEAQTRTYRSSIDESVQEYCLLPAQAGSPETGGQTGILVSLHDAGESAQQHLSPFSPQESVHILAPSGRRAEGCDWEDWSARNVLEALDDAVNHVKFDPHRAWLRGTSAGGHGVLRLGGIAADRWAALAPREPWLEYPVEPDAETNTPLEAMLERVAWSNRLTPLLRNTAICGLLLEQDESSSSSQELRELLEEFHPKFESRTIEGAEIALSPVLEFCKKYTTVDSKAVEEVDCVTYNPGVNAKIHWLTILNQHEAGSLSRAAVRFDSQRNLFLGLTANVASLAIDVSHLEMDTIVEVALDGEAVGEFAVEGRPLTFLRNEAGWQLVPALPPSFKQPQRYGGMQSAFENRPILVYGTRGSFEERTWALAKARYDAETILVRHNGSVDVTADTAFDPSQTRDRNVVTYGNADTNTAWPRLLSTSPVQVRRDGVWIDRRPELGDELACAFVRPRRGSDTAVVGVVGGTGIVGMRATDRLPYFVNGTPFPDLLLFGAASLTEGSEEVRAAGYFGRVWTVDPGEIVWRDAAL